jgi:hypothetical protein
LANQAGLAESLKIDHGTSIEEFQVTQIDQAVSFPTKWSKATLGQAPLQRHLATFETGLDTTTGAGVLTLVALAGRFTGPGAMATTNTLLAMCRTV